MKLRIDGNSLRFRLSRSEVAQLDRLGHIEQTIQFGPLTRLTYGITTSENFTISSTYDSSCIQVKVPRTLAQDWATSDRVDISAEQPVGSDNTLQILIEKDFQCLHKDTDTNPDAYPNPLASKQS